MEMVLGEKIQNIAPKKKTNKYYLLGYNEKKECDHYQNTHT